MTTANRIEALLEQATDPKVQSELQYILHRYTAMEEELAAYKGSGGIRRTIKHSLHTPKFDHFEEAIDPDIDIKPGGQVILAGNQVIGQIVDMKPTFCQGHKDLFPNQSPCKVLCQDCIAAFAID